jgi:phosphoglycerate dehydrogenase-like enzyme
MRIAFAGTFAVRLAEPVRMRLSVPCEVITDHEMGIVSRLGSVDVLITMCFTKEMADAGPRLKLIQVPGAGLDRIERAALRPGTRLANAYGHEVAIAEYIIGAMIALQGSFGRIDAKLRCGHWESQWAVAAPPPPPWPELAGKTLGILGFGHVGKAVARRARAFDMQVCAIRRQAGVKTPAGLSFIGGPEQLDDVLREADHLAITLPLSPQTQGFLDARRLRLMKSTAYLINVARAGNHRRGGPLSGSRQWRPRRSGPRRLVSLSNRHRDNAPRKRAFPRTRKRDHDTACIGLDGGHA